MQITAKSTFKLKSKIRFSFLGCQLRCHVIKMAQNGSKFFRNARNASDWFGVVQNGSESLKKAVNGWDV